MCRLMMTLSCENGRNARAYIYIIYTYIYTFGMSLRIEEKREKHLYFLSRETRRSRKNSWKSTKFILMLMTFDSLERKRKYEVCCSLILLLRYYFLFSFFLPVSVYQSSVNEPLLNNSLVYAKASHWTIEYSNVMFSKRKETCSASNLPNHDSS